MRLLQHSFRGFNNTECKDKLLEYEDKFLTSLIKVADDRDY